MVVDNALRAAGRLFRQSVALVLAAAVICYFAWIVVGRGRVDATSVSGAAKRGGGILDEAGRPDGNATAATARVPHSATLAGHAAVGVSLARRRVGGIFVRVAVRVVAMTNVGPV